MSQLLALSAAALYGVADFAGGLATRSISAWRVTVWSQIFGLPLLTISVVLLGYSHVTATDLLLGAIAGAFGLVGLILLYSALAAGSMSIVAPIIGVLAASVPVLWDVTNGGRVSTIQWVGIGIAILAVILLASHGSGSSITGRILLQSVGAALAFAVFVIAMSETNEASGLWPLASARMVSVVLGFIVLATTSTVTIPDRSLLRITAFVGNTEIAAGIALVLAVQRGPLGVNAVISSLYPAFTVLAALIVLRERPGHAQVVGIVLAIVAVMLLAL